MRFAFWGSLAMFLFAAISANATLTQSDGCYLIGSADDLYQFKQIYDSYDEDSLAMRLDCVKLTQDIVVNENVLKEDGSPNAGPFKEWESINRFSGTFDGQNHTISGLYQKSFDHLGLFFYLRGTVKNLGIVDSYFYVPDSTYNSRIGAIAAQVYDTVTIENSYSAATIEVLSGGNGVAGLVGLVGGSAMLTIKDCHNEGVIVSTYERSSSTGGLVGYVALSSTVILFNSYNTGSVSGYGDVGGLMGRVESSSRLDDRSAKFIIEKCYNSGAVYGLTTNVGGLVGAGQGTIKESYNVGYVKAASAVGGLVGSANIDLIGTVNNSDTLRIENSYNRGTVETFLPEGEFDYPIGGFVGSVERVLPFIVNSYNAADIIQNGKVKNGLIGKIEYSELVIEKTVNRKVSDGTPCDGVTDVEDSLFFNGVVATYLHQNNEVWGQKSIGEGMYPDLSGKVNASVSVYPITWHTFEGDTNDYPSTYTLGMGLKLPENFERKGYIFEGWYAVANPTDKDVKLDKIGTTETGAKTLYARWTRLLDFDGRCYLISDAQELYNFASIVNGTYGGDYAKELLHTYYTDRKIDKTWGINFKRISLNHTSISSFSMQSVIKIENNFIKAPYNFLSVLNREFLYLSEIKQKCSLYTSFNYQFVLCNKDFDVNKFPKMEFYSDELNYTFVFEGKDLFIFDEKNNNYLFLVIFDIYNKKQTGWELGLPFLLKYKIFFDFNDESLGIVETIKSINSNSLKGIANVIIISFLIGIIFSYLFLLPKKIQRKKRLNELEDELSNESIQN